MDLCLGVCAFMDFKCEIEKPKKKLLSNTQEIGQIYTLVHKRNTFSNHINRLGISNATLSHKHYNDYSSRTSSHPSITIITQNHMSA